jgi:hypothetical protein
MDLKLVMKKRLPENWDVEYYHNIISRFPENEWFYPSNLNSDNEFTICDQLAHEDIIVKCVVPSYKNGSFIGHMIYFFYNSSLDYSKLLNQ